MNRKLKLVMELKDDTQQELAEYLGLRSYVSVHRKIYGETRWSEEQIKKVCKRYKMSRQELGL